MYCVCRASTVCNVWLLRVSVCTTCAACTACSVYRCVSTCGLYYNTVYTYDTPIGPLGVYSFCHFASLCTSLPFASLSLYCVCTLSVTMRRRTYDGHASLISSPLHSFTPSPLPHYSLIPSPPLLPSSPFLPFSPPSPAFSSAPPAHLLLPPTACSLFSVSVLSHS